MSNFDENLNNLIRKMDNEYVSGAVSLFLILYAGMAAPKLPERIARLFESTLFKILIFFLIAYIGQKKPTVAIIVAVAMVVSLQTLHRHEINRKMINMVPDVEDEDDGDEEPVRVNTLDNSVQNILNSNDLSEMNAEENIPAANTEEKEYPTLTGAFSDRLNSVVDSSISSDLEGIQELGSVESPHTSRYANVDYNMQEELLRAEDLPGSLKLARINDIREGRLVDENTRRSESIMGSGIPEEEYSMIQSENRQSENITHAFNDDGIQRIRSLDSIRESVINTPGCVGCDAKKRVNHTIHGDTSLYEFKNSTIEDPDDIASFDDASLDYAEF